MSQIYVHTQVVDSGFSVASIPPGPVVVTGKSFMMMPFSPPSIIYINDTARRQESPTPGVYLNE